MQVGLKRLEEADVRNVSLTNLDVLADVAAELGYIPEKHKEALLHFRDNPADESWMGALS